ncbi:hypothetical protein MIR68_012587 [Amoeboaphelidium protococcarum]|nr:hypothetical protein MIR68_012587 [Amoeboaphelidium protococcarum]
MDIVRSEKEEEKKKKNNINIYKGEQAEANHSLLLLSSKQQQKSSTATTTTTIQNINNNSDSTREPMFQLERDRMASKETDADPTVAAGKRIAADVQSMPDIVSSTSPRSPYTQNSVKSADAAGTYSLPPLLKAANTGDSVDSRISGISRFPTASPIVTRYNHSRYYPHVAQNEDNNAATMMLQLSRQSTDTHMSDKTTYSKAQSLPSISELIGAVNVTGQAATNQHKLVSSPTLMSPPMLSPHVEFPSLQTSQASVSSKSSQALKTSGDDNLNAKSGRQHVATNHHAQQNVSQDMFIDSHSIQVQSSYFGARSNDLLFGTGHGRVNAQMSHAAYVPLPRYASTPMQSMSQIPFIPPQDRGQQVPSHIQSMQILNQSIIDHQRSVSGSQLSDMNAVLSSESLKRSASPMDSQPYQALNAVKVGNDYLCQSCDLKFPSKELWRSHSFHEHGLSDFRCEICGSYFGFNISLKRHLSSTEKNSGICSSMPGPRRRRRG